MVMKELTIEEKAKAYDKALELAESYYDDPNCFKHMEGCLEHIFPELKESEDERIRKQIKAFIKSRGSQITQSKTDSWLAWLEKQGEQKPYGQRKKCFDCQFNYAGECKGSCAMKSKVSRSLLLK